MYSPSTRWRLLECLLIFILLPVLIAWLKPDGLIFGILWILVGICTYILKRHYGWTFREDWNVKALTCREIRRMLLRFLPLSLGLVWFTWCLLPGELFRLPLEHPMIWCSIMLLYPPLSILPQEIVYRSFFLRRYTPLVPNPEHVRVLCALAFGWMHIIMLNWPAVLLSTIGGLLFADTYQRSKSLAAACFEHMLYGCFVFTVGLGAFFYHGHAIR